MTAFERASPINPNYSIVHTWMAGALGRLGRYEEASSAIETGLRLDPLSKVAINNYVMGLIDTNRLDEAGQELEKIASIYPVTYADAKG